MKISFFNKIAVALALGLGAQAAMAIDLPSAGGQTGENGSLIVTVFDPVKGNSLVQVLSGAQFTGGLANYSEFTPSQVTPNAGLTMSFNIDLSFFTNNGSSLSNLQYTVFAGDSAGSATQMGSMFTAAVGLLPSDIPLTNGQVVGMNGSSQTVAQFAPNPATSLTGTNFGATGNYVGGDDWGDQFGSFLPVVGSASLGTSMGFYQATRSGVGASTAANVTAYQNANGAATWLLTSNGTLTYTSPTGVPLPGALWLLLSGLGGMGMIGRRRTAAAAAAAVAA